MDCQNAGAYKEDQKPPENEKVHEARCHIALYEPSSQERIQQHFFERIG